MKRELLTIFVTSLLAFVGASTGSVISNYYTEKSWTQQIEFSQRRQLLEKRLDLIERFTKTVASFQNVATYRELLDLESLNVLRKSKTNDNYQVLSDERRAELGDRTEATKQEYSSLVMMSAIHFGPRTKSALVRLKDNSKSWYLPEGEDLQRLYDAMASELQYWGEN